MVPDDLRSRSGPVAVVTGASDGIGRAFAAALAARGLDLVLVARWGAVLEGVAADLARRHGVRTRVLAFDLAAPGAVAWLLAEVAQEEVGLLVAAAGSGSSGAFLDQDIAEGARMVDLNCRAVVELSHGLGRPMAGPGRGSLVLFGSLVGFQRVPWSATYAATKAFVQSFAEGLAGELAPSGVAVLSVAPGPVASGFGAWARITMGATDRPEAVAEEALRALVRGRRTLRPGRMDKALGWSLSLLPQPVRVFELGWIMCGMARAAP